MTDIIIRRANNEEMRDLNERLLNYVFGSSPPLKPPDDLNDFWEYIVKDSTCVAAFRDKNPVASAFSSTISQCIRGKKFPVSAIWGVGSYPSVRRKGIVRQCMTEILAITRDEGKPISCLYPFRESFYERMGYVSFPQPRDAIFPASALAPILKMELDGDCVWMPREKGADIYYEYLQKFQQATPGMAIGSERVLLEWESALKRYWLLLAQANGQTIGMACYRIQDHKTMPDEKRLAVPIFYYENSLAKYLLLRWFAHHIDQVHDVEIRLAPNEDIETWLSDMEVRYHFRDPGMSRIVDVLALNGIETGEGAFTASIQDPYCPWNEGVYRFETINRHLQISEEQEVDCHLTIQALTALVYGVRNPEDFAIRGWGNPSKPTIATMRQMFPPLSPYMFTEF